MALVKPKILIGEGIDTNGKFYEVFLADKELLKKMRKMQTQQETLIERTFKYNKGVCYKVYDTSIDDLLSKMAK